MGMHDAMFFKVLEECMQLPSLFQGLRQVKKKKKGTLVAILKVLLGVPKEETHMK